MISVLKALLLSIALGCAGAGTIAAPDGPTVSVGNVVFEVEVADTLTVEEQRDCPAGIACQTCPG